MESSYVFISYAHADKDTVLPIINAMQKAGINLWYDIGIEAGSEWPEYIAEKVNSCARFALFISKAYLDSQNCKRELNFAISRKKALLSIYLEDVNLSLGMEMQLGTYQSVFRERFSTYDQFILKLCKERFFEECVVRGNSTRIPNEENKHKSSQLVIENGSANYVGEAVNSVPQGYGKATYKSGGTYEGQWHQGCWHGQGKYVFDDGGYYVGEFVDGCFHGYGTEYNPDGSIFYVGEFKDDEYCGQGRMYFEEDEYIEGIFFDGELNGYGRQVFSDGGGYEGEFFSGEYNGHGRMTFDDGGFIEGDWIDGELNGEGFGETATGIQYRGEYSDSVRQGKGRMVWPNGNVYKGEFFDGNRHGQGTMIWSTGESWTGQWVEDKPWNGSGTYLYNDSVNTIPFVDGKHNGYGKVVWDGGSSYEGNILNNQFHGQGKHITSDGVVRAGEFKNHELYNGTEHNAQGKLIAEYKDGIKKKR